MNSTLAYVVDRAREPSSWRGVVWILTALGVSLNQDQSGAIMAAGTAVAGLIGVFARDPAAPPSA